MLENDCGSPSYITSKIKRVSPKVSSNSNLLHGIRKVICIPGHHFLPHKQNYRTRSSYQCHLIVTKRSNRSRGSQALSSCKGIMGLDPRGETSHQQCPHPTDSKTRTTQIYNPFLRFLERGTREPQASPAVMNNETNLS